MIDPELQIVGLVAELHKHVVSQFPLTCSRCSRVFSTFFEYASQTVPLGSQGSTSLSGAGLLALSNCHCGSTLSLTYAPAGAVHDRLIEALRADAKAEQRSTEEVGAALLEMIVARSLGRS